MRPAVHELPLAEAVPVRGAAVGLILPPEEELLRDPHFTDFLAGLAARLAEAATEVVLISASGVETYRDLVERQAVSGFVVALPKAYDERIVYLLEAQVPFVVHGQSAGDETYPFYDIDNHGAFFAATAHLIDLGHKRIGLLNGPAGTMYAGHRFDGYLHAVMRAGLSPAPELMSNARMNEESGYGVAGALLELPIPPTAMVCGSTVMALGAARRIREAGLTVGGDFALVSHDDGLSAVAANDFAVPLTVTRAPIHSAGIAAAEILLRRMAGTPAEDLRIIAPVELVVGASSCPPLRASA